MGERWVFEQDGELKWSWTRSDDDERIRSGSSFAECVDCMLDAIRHAVQRRRSASCGTESD